MSGQSLVERIKGIATFNSRVDSDSDLPAILADVRELESAARFAHQHLTNQMHDVRDGSNGCRLCEAQGKLSAILTKCAKEST